MKQSDGYDIPLKGRPYAKVESLPEPDVLHLPLRTRRFAFDEVCVKEGDQVHPGHALARDRGNFSVPLLAPRAGTVRLQAAEGHVTLEGITQEAEEPYHPDEDAEHAVQDVDSSGKRRCKLLALGAWQFLCDAHTGALPDPFSTPSAVIVSTLRLEPFGSRGDVQMVKRLSSFTRGLEHLQSLLEYQPIYLVVPDIKGDLAERVRDVIRGYAWVKVVQVPMRYPLDDFNLLARRIGLKPQKDEPVWGLRTEGVLAVDRALTLSRPCTVRLISLGGPGVVKPRHLKAISGYPLADIVKSRVSEGPMRVICGGALTGDMAGDGQLGLDAESMGLTVLPEHTEREFLGFMRPGTDRGSYSKCFLSALRGKFAERLDTALRGERRPCVSCNYCEEVCPAGIMPHLIHKYLYMDALEEAEQTGVDLCVECGLCSFVCPSKIDLRQQFIDAKQAIREELHPEEVHA